VENFINIAAETGAAYSSEYIRNEATHEIYDRISLANKPTQHVIHALRQLWRHYNAARGRVPTLKQALRRRNAPAREQ
jgi:hypothetical protein